ncbi:AGC/YANK protein kinase [Coprinopsis cinerea AmutBmut pab1-1]|nr:AGC/YANK protein kinase [Coprinopsis cinerea AmutBmut pab1-1]
MAPETQGDAFPVFEGYEILARLKSGEFRGLAKRGRLKGRHVVIKKVAGSVKAADSETLLRTLSIHQSLHHPNVVASLASFCQDDEAYHVLELCSGGNLENYLSQTQHALATHQFRLLLQGTANALVYLQGQGILHRNIQPSSIYVAEDDRFKLGNFQYAVRVQDSSETELPPHNLYTPPEVEANKRYTYAADVWSLGRVLLFASSRQVHSKEAALCTVNSDWSDLLETVEAPSLISGMLKESPSERLTALQIQEYSWSWKVMGILDRSLESALDQSKPALNCDSQLEKLLGSVSDLELSDLQVREATLSKRLPTELARYRTFREAYRVQRYASDPFPMTTPSRSRESRRRTVSEQLDLTPAQVNDAFLCDETGDDPLASSGELNFSFSTGDSCESSSDESIDGALQDYPPSQNDLHISLQNNGQSAGELLLWSPDFVPSILTPKIYPFSAGTIQILQSRYLLIEGRSGHHRPLLVDPTGTFVKVLDLDYSPADIDNHDLEIERTAANTISNLPGVLVAQYEAARTYLEELKSRTPMLIMHVVEGKCMLMCNSPLPDVEILVRSSTSRGSVRMLRVRFLRRSGTIEFAQRETSDCRAEWQKKVCSCQNVLPVVGPDEEQDLDDMERRALKLLRDFIRVCDVVEKGCVNRNQ